MTTFTLKARPASSPCMLDEFRAEDSRFVDQEQARDVTRWRKTERACQIARRLALSPEFRCAQTRAIIGALDALVPPTAATIVNVYWPMRGEPDLRPWMSALALMDPLPLAIGVGFPGAEVATIFPQPHDIAMHRIVAGGETLVLPQGNGRAE